MASLSAFAVGLHWGLVGVAVAYALSSTIVEPYYSWLTARALHLSVFAFPRALAGVFQAVAGMVLALALTRLALAGTGLGPFPRLLMLVLVGALAYVPLVLWRVPEVRVLARRVRRPRRKSTARGAGALVTTMRVVTLPYRLGAALPDGIPVLVYLRRPRVPRVAVGGNCAALGEEGRGRSEA